MKIAYENYCYEAWLGTEIQEDAGARSRTVYEVGHRSMRGN
jgi:hypothetical protein